MERHEVTSGLLSTWRRKAMSGQLLDPPLKTLPGAVAEPSFAEVRVVEPAAIPPPQLPSSLPDAPGRIGIELPTGVRLSVDATVDADALARVLSVLARGSRFRHRRGPGWPTARHIHPQNRR